MKNGHSNRSVVCFGEILWDVLPDKRKPGGAPMNVAYHLHKLGINSSLVSSIGNDIPGTDLIEFLGEIGLSTKYVQITQQYATSEVLARINENHEVSYEIVYPVAWDNIDWSPEHEQLIKNAGAFVFGSLSLRDKVSRTTLFKMLDHAAYRIFDVNLRAPHYTVGLITSLLERSNLVKLNLAELMMIAGWYNANCKTEADGINTLFNRFNNVQEILITKGSKGASYYTPSYYTPSYRYDHPAYSISVADTIGSGDAFLAAFLAMKLRNESLETTLDYAVAMGAFITSQSGACPAYSKFDLERFIWKRKFLSKTNQKSNESVLSGNRH